MMYVKLIWSNCEKHCINKIECLDNFNSLHCQNCFLSFVKYFLLKHKAEAVNIETALFFFSQIAKRLHHSSEHDLLLAIVSQGYSHSRGNLIGLMSECSVNSQYNWLLIHV